MLGVSLLKPFIMWILIREVRVWGDKSRLKISPKASTANTIFNTISGQITIGDYTFTGHNVSIITGIHDCNTFLRDRLFVWPSEGGDIHIGKGVWIGSNVTILGPCDIGDHAVIAAGAVVTKNVMRGSIVAGVPAKVIKKIENLPV